MIQLMLEVMLVMMVIGDSGDHDGEADDEVGDDADEDIYAMVVVGRMVMVRIGQAPDGYRRWWPR